MQSKRLISSSVALLLALVAGCASKSPAPPPVCPKPAQLPAWVIEAANGPSLTERLERIIEPYGLESEN